MPTMVPGLSGAWSARQFREHNGHFLTSCSASGVQLTGTITSHISPKQSSVSTLLLDIKMRFFSNTLNTSLAFTVGERIILQQSVTISPSPLPEYFQVPLFSFTVPGGSSGNSLSQSDDVVQQLFTIFGFILLFSFGLVPLLLGLGTPTLGRYPGSFKQLLARK